MKANCDDVFDEYIANLTLSLNGLPYDDEFMREIETFSGYDSSLLRKHVRRVVYLNSKTPEVDHTFVIGVVAKAVRDYVASKPTDKYRSLDAQWEGP